MKTNAYISSKHKHLSDVGVEPVTLIHWIYSWQFLILRHCGNIFLYLHYNVNIIISMRDI